MIHESRVVVPENSLRRLVRDALREDWGRGDATTRRILPGRPRGVGMIRAKEKLLLAGLPVANLVFQLTDPALHFEPIAREGEWLKRGDPVARIRGRAASILKAERTALNFLQHLSGIATYTAEC